ncbi:MAG: sigma-70 family RNA polymerase sigma factor, partial [Akkermansiaceae bacterium]
MRIARSRIHNEDLAKDVAQQVFILLTKKAGTLSDHPSIIGWLNRTTILEAKKMIRCEYNRSKREGLYLEKIDILSNRFSEDEFYSVHEALSQLGEEYRDAIVLRYNERKSFEEIGRILDRSPCAAQRMISRAINKLRHLVSDLSDLSCAACASCP